MSRSGTHLARARMTLAVLPLVWIALHPILPQLHHVVATHGHRFSPELGRFEDVPANSVASAAASPAPVRNGVDWTRADRHGDAHVMCLLSNTVPQPTVSSSLGGWAVPAPRPDTKVGGAADRCPSLTPLTQAPKQSPPVSAA
jgi:hypothetical protein